jgi:hypothetical protein
MSSIVDLASGFLDCSLGALRGLGDFVASLFLARALIPRVGIATTERR